MAPSSLVEEPIKVDFTWEIVEFTPYYAKIQLYFDLPESVSAVNGDSDDLVITFWAGDLFQAESGKTVRPGLTIRTPVTRQVSTDDKNKYSELGR